MLWKLAHFSFEVYRSPRGLCQASTLDDLTWDGTLCPERLYRQSGMAWCIVLVKDPVLFMLNADKKSDEHFFLPFSVNSETLLILRWRFLWINWPIFGMFESVFLRYRRVEGVHRLWSFLVPLGIFWTTQKLECAVNIQVYTMDLMHVTQSQSWKYVDLLF